MTTKWIVGVVAVLLWQAGAPTPAAGQQQPAVVRTTARVLSIGARVTTETMTALLEGLQAGCISAEQRCDPRSGTWGRNVRHSGLATVRAENECSEGRKAACAPVVSVEFLWN
jgi:hypothetical protein